MRSRFPKTPSVAARSTNPGYTTHTKPATATGTAGYRQQIETHMWIPHWTSRRDKRLTGSVCLTHTRVAETRLERWPMQQRENSPTPGFEGPPLPWYLTIYSLKSIQEGTYAYITERVEF